MKKKGDLENSRMNLNRFFANRSVVIVTMIVMDIVIMMCINYLGNFLYGFSSGRTYQQFSLNNLLLYHGPDSIWFPILLIGLILVFDVWYGYKVYISYSEKSFNTGQKGKERWTTKEEIKKQYKEIPEKNENYEGPPGTLIAHFGGHLYIDTAVSNTLILGITRSGKGEMYVFPTIDLYSRSSEKPSLVITDPKLENYKASKETLEKRGYEVHLLNLDNPLKSMGINLLYLIIDLYKKGEPSTAFSMARSLAYSIFHSSLNEGGNSEPIWANTATDLFSALIIAVVTDELELDKSVNEMRAQAYRLKVQTYKNLDEKEREKADETLQEVIRRGRDPITERTVAAIPDTWPYRESCAHENMISIYNIVIFFTELVRDTSPENPAKSALDEYFAKRDIMDLAKLKFATVESASERTKGSVYTNMLSSLGVFLDENVAKMTAESSLNLEDVGFGKKPVAIFIGTPDYDKSTHFIASIFIRQLYYILAKKATNSPSQKCYRQVRFVVDEFGNLPEIEGMDQLITVGNGRGIGFDLYVQSFRQIQNLYGENAQTIIDNCANKIYIKSADDETLKYFCSMIGNRTIIDIQRTGEKMSLGKNYIEAPAEEPLIRPEEMKSILQGENIVVRELKRKDLSGNDIHGYPIYNSKKEGMAFPYRYQYLTDTFPNPTEIDLDSVNTENREHIDLRERLINVSELLRGIDNTLGMKPEFTLFDEMENYSIIDKKLKEEIGESYRRRLHIRPETTLSEFLEIIENTSLISEQTRMALRAVAG